jgi:hypothetical protein
VGQIGIEVLLAEALDDARLVGDQHHGA